MTKYACDICESIYDISRLSFNVGSKVTNGEDVEYIVEDLDVCNVHVRMLAMYLLNRLSRREDYEEQIAAYKYLQTIAKNIKQEKEGL